MNLRFSDAGKARLWGNSFSALNNTLLNLKNLKNDPFVNQKNTYVDENEPNVFVEIVVEWLNLLFSSVIIKEKAI